MSLSFLSTCSPLPPALSGRVLGGFRIADGAPAVPAAWPRQQLSTPVLGTVEPLQECWLAPEGAPMLAGGHDGIAWRRSGDLLFGVIEIDEASLRPPSSRTPLQQAAFDAYTRIFRLLDAQGLPHLWRLWNHMADINGESHGLERYRQFNMGRGDAFEAGARSVIGRVPAACALGVASGPLTVAFLAGATPTVPIENPRQVSAFLYPSRYGPRSPTFSRAALAHPPGQEILFVSGTASIVGHQTVHAGDVHAQTLESLDNMAAVLDQASAVSRVGPFALPDLVCRVYVRHPADLPQVREAVAARMGGAPVVCVQADVCRADLLVEIEGQAIRSLPELGDGLPQAG
jgi:chorismate lyase / 3-hydroxybenzoate synthase